MTTAITLTTAWQKLVDAGDEFTLTFAREASNDILVESQASEEAPEGAVGTYLRVTVPESWNRALAGPGYLYARAASGTSVINIVAWTPA